MLCTRCRQAATLATRQSRNLSTARLVRSSLAIGVSARPAPRCPTRAAASTASTRYSSTSSPEAVAGSPASSPISTPTKPDYLDEAESEIWDLLTTEFVPSELMVQDISGGCGSMYGIEIASDKFRGTTMLKQQRMVNAALGERMKEWHGVQLRTKVPPS